MSKIRLTVAYNQPPDPGKFFQHYQQVHVPLAQKVPGLQGFDWSKVVGTPAGEAPRYAIIAELTFASMESFEAAMSSAEGQAAQADLADFAPNGADLFICEVAGS